MGSDPYACDPPHRRRRYRRRQDPRAQPPQGAQPPYRRSALLLPQGGLLRGRGENGHPHPRHRLGQPPGGLPGAEKAAGRAEGGHHPLPRRPGQPDGQPDQEILQGPGGHHRPQRLPPGLPGPAGGPAVLREHQHGGPAPGELLHRRGRPHDRHPHPAGLPRRPDLHRLQRHRLQDPHPPPAQGGVPEKRGHGVAGGGRDRRHCGPALPCQGHPHPAEGHEDRLQGGAPSQAPHRRGRGGPGEAEGHDPGPGPGRAGPLRRVGQRYELLLQRH